MNIQLPANNWEPRDYQLPFWDYMERTPVGARAILCWHRRAGKDHTCINWTATASARRVGLYIHVFPYANQGRRIVWNGIDKDGHRFLSAFPDDYIVKRNDMEMTLHLASGSIYQILGADDPDRLVGINCVGAVFSEFALMDPMAWRLVLPILNENGGWALFPSTPRGRNHFHALTQAAKANPKWFVSEKTIKDTGAISEESVEEDRKLGVDEAIIQQEYYVSFNASLQGAYFEKQMNHLQDLGRLTSVPHDPALTVNTAWDLGLDDEMAIWVYQKHGNEIRVIDFISGRGEGMGHYFQQLKLAAASEDWVFGYHYGPHDLAVREMTSGKSRLDTARSLGFNFRLVPKAISKEDAIEAARQTLPSCWIDKERCERGIEALKSYRRLFDEKTRTYKNQPFHDWSSHPADAFMTLACGERRGSTIKQHTLQTQAVTDYDPLSYR